MESEKAPGQDGIVIEIMKAVGNKHHGRWNCQRSRRMTSSPFYSRKVTGKTLHTTTQPADTYKQTSHKSHKEQNQPNNGRLRTLGTGCMLRTILSNHSPADIRKKNGYQLPLYMAFDYSDKAFDSIKYVALFKGIQKHGVPKIISIIKEAYWGGTAQVKTVATRPRSREVWVKVPYCPQSSSLMHLMRNSSRRWNRHDHQWREDVIIFANIEEGLNKIVEKLDTEHSKLGVLYGRGPQTYWAAIHSNYFARFATHSPSSNAFLAIAITHAYIRKLNDTLSSIGQDDHPWQVVDVLGWVVGGIGEERGVAGPRDVSKLFRELSGSRDAHSENLCHMVSPKFTKPVTWLGLLHLPLAFSIIIW